MNQIIDNLVTSLNISKQQIENTLALIQQGNTIPFIARYRKEQTHNLDEEQIRAIYKEYHYLEKLTNRKNEVLKLIDEKGLLTPEIVASLQQAKILQEIEDIYLPFKEKRKTKATEAIKNGLEPLSDFILKQPEAKNSIVNEASKYLNEKTTSIEDAIINAGYIIAENISENSEYRQFIRKYIYHNATLLTSVKKDYEQKDPLKKYEIYYQFSNLVKKLKPYQILALNRAEKENIINIKFDIDEEYILNYLAQKIITKNSDSKLYLQDFIKDSYKRLINPSIIREIRNQLSEKADAKAIEVFAKNLEHLLMQSPVKNKIVLGMDPAYRTGCKLAVIDQTGKVLAIDVIYPTKPKEDIKGSCEKVLSLINKFNINQIVIGNGTASRETEAFAKEFVKKYDLEIPIAIISEAGASVYSASKIAQSEFPNLSVEQRSAVSIARRIQDPMAELVKIEPKSIGVGQYQHDVNQKELEETLDFVMEKNINKVGVNINTASGSLLQYVAGLDKTSANNIVSYRETNGSFKNREEIKNVKRLGPKTFEQCAGFLKIFDGDNYLDQTFIHPESYAIAQKMINHYQLNLNDLGTNSFLKSLENIDINECSLMCECSVSLIQDIIKALSSAQIDIREELEAPQFDTNITSIEMLNPGMKLKGQIRNIVDFGAFVDIGIKNDALLHISEITQEYIKDINDYIKLGEIKEFKIKDINIEKGRVELTLK